MRFFNFSTSSRVGRFRLRTIGSTPFPACFSMSADDALPPLLQIFDGAPGALLRSPAQLLRLREEVFHCSLTVFAEELARILADPADDCAHLRLGRA